MNPGLRLWLVRHGQTDWNATGLCLGLTDLPLNQNGKDAVRNLQKYINLNACDVIYVSPLKRTIKTANILVNRKPVPQKIINDLREIDFGHWEGKSWDKIQRYYESEWFTWKQNPIYSAPYGGESLSDVANRAESFLKVLKTQLEGQTILLVSHGGFLNNHWC